MASTTRRKPSTTKNGAAKNGAAKNGAAKNSRAKSSRLSRPKSKGSEESEGGKTHDIWRGIISFGLVEIPIALVSTEKPGGVSLSLLDKRDLSPVGYRRYNKSTEEDVAWAEVVHGYEYEKGQFVVVSKKDVAQADPELANTIAIDRFVEFSEVSPIQFDRTYYLEPLNARSKGYTLLRAALVATKKVGVARMLLRTREYVGLVAVHDSALVMHLLRFDAEIRKPSALENLGTPVKITEAESQMAEKLIDDMSGPWKPDEYRDEYTRSLMALIERKVKSGDVHEVERDAPEPKHHREVVDLMPLLKRSLEKRGSAASPPLRAPARRAHATATRRPAARRAARTRRS